jgi:hypothetical protein
MVRTTGISDSVRANLIEKIAERRIWIDIDLSAKTYTHLGRVVSSKYVTVLDEGNLASESRSG